TVGYKWFDAKKHEPMFEFGHGLSYTTVALQNLSASAEGHAVSVTFEMANTGARQGAHVAQLYVAHPGWEAPQRLAAFQKVELDAGESRKLTITIDPRLLAVYDSRQK